MSRMAVSHLSKQFGDVPESSLLSVEVVIELADGVANAYCVSSENPPDLKLIEDCDYRLETAYRESDWQRSLKDEGPRAFQ